MAKFKDFLTTTAFDDKRTLFQQKNKYRRFLPEKVPMKTWFQLDERTRTIIFPYYPCASGISGVFQVVFHPLHYSEYHVQWKWQYIHERGDALKIGKSPGLIITGGDPLLLPKKLRGIIYAIVFQLSPADYQEEEENAD